MRLDDRWTCHVCGELRPDERISVYKTTRVAAGGVEVTTNVRHCNDRAGCIAGAPAVDFTKPSSVATRNVVPQLDNRTNPIDIALLVGIIVVVVLCAAVMVWR